LILEYTLFIERSAQKSLSKIDTQDKVKIEDAMIDEQWTMDN